MTMTMLMLMTTTIKTSSSNIDGNDHADTIVTTGNIASHRSTIVAADVGVASADGGATADDIIVDDHTDIEDVAGRNGSTSISSGCSTSNSSSGTITIETLISPSDTKLSASSPVIRNLQSQMARSKSSSYDKVATSRENRDPMRKSMENGMRRRCRLQQRAKTITYPAVFLIIISSLLLWTQVRFVKKTTTKVTIMGRDRIVQQRVFGIDNTKTTTVAAGAVDYITSGGFINCNIHVVVSHCDEPLEWIFTKFLTTTANINDENVAHGNSNINNAGINININIKSFTVISKCGKAPNQTDVVGMLSSLTSQSSSISSHNNMTINTPTTNDSSISTNSTGTVQVLELPNVGRCDHSYAFWIQQMTMTRRELKTTQHLQHHRNYDNDDDDLVLFMKGNDNMYRTEFDEIFDFPTLVKKTVETSSKKHIFSCGSKKVGLPNTKRVDATNIADRMTLMEFKIDSYNRSHVGAKNSTNDDDNSDFEAPQRPLGSWLHSLLLGNSSEFIGTEGFMPICYGGVFMTTIGSIFSSPVQDWTPFVDSLSRGDNIEEGHYMERVWAGLLSPSISNEERMAVQRRFKGVVNVGAWTGMVMLKKSSVWTRLQGTRRGISRIIHDSNVR